jgi:hypothetical protein
MKNPIMVAGFGGANQPQLEKGGCWPVGGSEDGRRQEIFKDEVAKNKILFAHFANRVLQSQ